METQTPESNRKGYKNFHPFEQWDFYSKTGSNWVEFAAQWLHDESNNAFEHCYDHNRRKLRCNCFVHFKENKAYCYSVAEYMAYYMSCSRQARDTLIWSLLSVQHDSVAPVNYMPHQRYKVPFFGSKWDAPTLQKLQKHRVCQSAFQHVFDLGKKKWRTLIAAVVQGVPTPKHRLGGKESNRQAHLMHNSVFDDMRVYFEGLKDCAERIVRDADNNTYNLPAHMTKRGLYKEFCYGRGQLVTYTNKGNVRFEPRMVQGWNGEPLHCPALSTFVAFWKKEYPELVITK